jgi:hypothetical protein
MPELLLAYREKCNLGMWLFDFSRYLVIDLKFSLRLFRPSWRQLRNFWISPGFCCEILITIIYFQIAAVLLYSTLLLLMKPSRYLGQFAMILCVFFICFLFCFSIRFAYDSNFCWQMNAAIVSVFWLCCLKSHSFGHSNLIRFCHDFELPDSYWHLVSGMISLCEILLSS